MGEWAECIWLTQPRILFQRLQLLQYYKSIEYIRRGADVGGKAKHGGQTSENLSNITDLKPVVGRRKLRSF